MSWICALWSWLASAAAGCRHRVPLQDAGGVLQDKSILPSGVHAGVFLYMESWAIDLQHFLNPTYGYCTNLIITTVNTAYDRYFSELTNNLSVLLKLRRFSNIGFALVVVETPRTIRPERSIFVIFVVHFLSACPKMPTLR